MKFNEFLFGSSDKIKQKTNFTPGQTNYFNQYLNQAQQGLGGMNDMMSLLQSMLDPNSEFFKNFENQQMNQFNQEIIPGISERFAGGGALSSSGFGQALGGAASNLQSNLAAGKSGMIMQALQQLMNQYNQQTQNILGAQPFSYVNKQGSAGFLPSVAGGFAQGLGSSLGGKLGG